MNIKNKATPDFRLSVEFFPPRTNEGLNKLTNVARKLRGVKPKFYSCTYGAGGSTKAGTLDTISHLKEEGFAAAPHLSIGSDEKSDILSILDQYQDKGINRIVALRGDLPSGIGRNRFTHNAETLINWIRDYTGDHFKIEVGAYPEVHPDAKSPKEDLRFFKQKVEAGADGAITQYFYNPHAYFDFVNRCHLANISLPIYPGIMPITNYEGIVKFSEACGAEIPRWIKKQLESYREDERSLKKFGEEVVTTLCSDLIAGGAPGLHFYTLNRSAPTLAILGNLGLAETSVY